MRAALLATTLALAAAMAASIAHADPPPTISTFRVERGAAPPPPESAPGAQRAPVEGVTPLGLDFGQWKSADPALYGPRFESQMRARYAGRDGAAARSDLEANGFACEEGRALQCRIEIMDQGCAKDWYVVFEPRRSEPIAGFDVMCLGARR